MCYFLLLPRGDHVMGGSFKVMPVSTLLLNMSLSDLPTVSRLGLEARFSISSSIMRALFIVTFFCTKNYSRCFSYNLPGTSHNPHGQQRSRKITEFKGTYWKWSHARVSFQHFESVMPCTLSKPLKLMLMNYLFQRIEPIHDCLWIFF